MLTGGFEDEYQRSFKSKECLKRTRVMSATLKELAKEFRKLNGTKMSAEIVLIGGAAILAKTD